MLHVQRFNATTQPVFRFTALFYTLNCRLVRAYLLGYARFGKAITDQFCNYFLKIHFKHHSVYAFNNASMHFNLQAFFNHNLMRIRIMGRS